MLQLQNIVLIFLGCGTGGGLLRYWISNFGYLLLGPNFPYGTLIVNISGSFFIGLLFVLIQERFDGIAVSLRALLLIGLLGGYTTFSSFSLETLNLIESANYVSAILNVFLSVLLCIISSWLGLLLGRQL